MNKYLEHLKTISMHKIYVARACFKTGHYIQGIMHDNSKYGITEFVSSAKHFQGHKSPISHEKEINGYSIAWQSHKGKNKHHWQYWIDWDKNGILFTIEIPRKYLSEMICDWIGAGKAYSKDKWSMKEFKSWADSHRDKIILHEDTRAFVDYLTNYVTNEKRLYEIIC